ncbi:MAG: HYExAFE family protein [Thermoguttaceae bacterium]
MANRDNHYEAAFEEFLRSRGVPYVAVDEAKRSLMSNGNSIKSLDFIVSGGVEVSANSDGDACAARSVTWLVDVKGRRFPSGDIQKQYWKNWSTRDDLQSLAQWERLFGASFRGLFVFAYDVLGSRSPLPAEELFEYRDSLYGFVAVALTDYAGHAHPISPRWDTWAMPAGDFRRFARPLAELLGLDQRLTQGRCDGGAANGDISKTGPPQEIEKGRHTSGRPSEL